MRRRPPLPWLLLVLVAAFAVRSAGCGRRAGTDVPGRLTPTRAPAAYTPFPKPPTATFIPGYITPIPDEPG